MTTPAREPSPVARPRRVFLGFVAAATAATMVGSTPVAMSAPSTPHGLDEGAASLTFPRTGTYFLEQDFLATIDQLDRYDVVVFSSEWQHRVPRSFFDELRVRNPRMKLLGYVNLVDALPRTGSPEYWTDAYSLWQFKDSTTSDFPRKWLAYTAAGKAVHEWEDHIMTNLTDAAPQVDGEIYAEYAANWVVDHVWATGIWDGIFLDVWGDRIYTADSDGWDISGKGIDEPGDLIYGPGGPLDRGLTIAETIMRERMPDALLVANGDRHPSGGKLDGLVFEGFADLLVDPGRIAEDEAAKYVRGTMAEGLRQPSTTITIDQQGTVVPGSAEEYRRARFFLTATLMQNGWWAPMGKDYSQPAYYDEMDGAGLGRGYLGSPVVANPDPQQLSALSTNGTGSPAPGVFRRDFEHGIALVNSSNQDHEIVLESSFRHLRGQQDPVVNNGATVGSVKIPANDGVILLRAT